MRSFATISEADHDFTDYMSLVVVVPADRVLVGAAAHARHSGRIPHHVSRTGIVIQAKLSSDLDPDPFF